MKKIIIALAFLFMNHYCNAQSNWSILGNLGTNENTHFLGTKDNAPLTLRVNNLKAGKISSGGFVSLGYEANSSLSSFSNTAIGHQVFKNINTANADWGTAIGYQAGYSNTTGDNLTFVGFRAGYGNTTGTNNLALGTYALGSEIGAGLSGSNNVAIGVAGLRYLSTGNRNIAIGFSAGIDDYPNVLGNKTSISDNDCIFIGASATRDASIPNTTSLSNAIAIGNNAKVSASNSLILGGSNSFAVNVGIGNTAPKNKLEITFGSANNSGLRFTNLTSNSSAASASGKVLSVNADGDVVLETSSIADGTETHISGGNNITVSGNGSAAAPYLISTVSLNNFWNAASIGSNNIINSNPGNVIIGDGISNLPSGYKLYVSGGILTEKLKVALKSSTNWADYVFENNYKLMPLKKVESFIKENKHLPNVPSAKTLEKDGIDVNEMLAKQMEKIEELTLYIIEVNKKVEKVEKENIALKKAISK
jgi:trimeric autotransporter adhesin